MRRVAFDLLAHDFATVSVIITRCVPTRAVMPSGPDWAMRPAATQPEGCVARSSGARSAPPASHICTLARNGERGDYGVMEDSRCAVILASPNEYRHPLFGVSCRHQSSIAPRYRAREC